MRNWPYVVSDAGAVQGTTDGLSVGGMEEEFETVQSIPWIGICQWTVEGVVLLIAPLKSVKLVTGVDPGTHSQPWMGTQSSARAYFEAATREKPMRVFMVDVGLL
jgi:hypothetical protein